MHYFLIYKKISELLFFHLLTDSALCEHDFSKENKFIDPKLQL